MTRVVRKRIHTPYMTVCLVIPLPRIQNINLNIWFWPTLKMTDASHLAPYGLFSWTSTGQIARTSDHRNEPHNSIEHASIALSNVPGETSGMLPCLRKWRCSSPAFGAGNTEWIIYKTVSPSAFLRKLKRTAYCLHPYLTWKVSDCDWEVHLLHAVPSVFGVNLSIY